MAKKIPIGNQEHLTEKQYAYYPTGIKKAVLIHILGRDECDCNWDDIAHVYVDKRNVYRRVPLVLPNN